MLTKRTIDAVLAKLAAAENTNPTPGQVPMPKVLPRKPAASPPMPKVLPRKPAASPPMPKVQPITPAPKEESWPRQVYRRGEGRGYRMPETRDGRPVSGGIVLDLDK